METIITAIITGGLALVGVIITNVQSNHRIENQLIASQAVTDVKIQNLTDEVRKHNAFGDRITVLEVEVNSLKERLNHVE